MGLGLALGLLGNILTLASCAKGLEGVTAERGFDPTTGFMIADGLETVRIECTRCHSARLVIQNRATRQGWKEIIRWMQQTQRLRDLGENEGAILDYLAKNYGPAERSNFRRPPLPARLRPPD